MRSFRIIGVKIKILYVREAVFVKREAQKRPALGERFRPESRHGRFR